MSEETVDRSLVMGKCHVTGESGGVYVGRLVSMNNKKQVKEWFSLDLLFQYIHTSSLKLRRTYLNEA